MNGKQGPPYLTAADSADQKLMTLNAAITAAESITRGERTRPAGHDPCDACAWGG